jgi:anthraniloyl-CoA monooxygenase
VRVAVVGGGPGGLFLAALLRKADPSGGVTVFERHRAEDAFGFGVVFSDRTLAAIDEADPVLRDGLREHGVHWDAIEVRLKGEVLRCGGNGMAAIRRTTLLRLLQDRARGFGADLRFSTEVRLVDLDGYDLVVAADGAGSAIRSEVGLESTVETATAKFIWFGTDHAFPGLTFVHERGPHGVFAVHGYPIAPDLGTFIVETDEASWRAAGLDAFDVTQPPGPSDETSRAYLEDLFADRIGGARLLTNNSRWGSFRTRRSPRWTVVAPRPVAFLGDAVHTAHFSVGSGTKMAMEDAVALSAALAAHDDLPTALAAYEAAARPSVERIQDSARPSLAWWEHVGRYHDHFPPWQFAYHFLSRSITDARLARRAPDFVAASHGRWVAEHGAEPLDTPLAIGGTTLPGRRAVLGLDTLEVPGAPALPLQEGHLHVVSGDEGGLPATGVRVRAPEDEGGMGAVRDRVCALAAAGAAFVVVEGGTAFTRTLVCEEVRMRHGLPAVLVDPDLTEDAAVTAVLSGRADLVARGGR